MSKHPKSEQLPVVVKDDEWVDVPKGMTPALGVIPHPDQLNYPGVLVMENDHTSVVRWHNKGCNRTGKLDPAKVVFDRNGAPWCPTCFAENMNRDPDWNSPPEDQTTTLTPNPESVADYSRKTRSQRNREAIARGKFRDPAHRGAGGTVVGDDNLISKPTIGDLSAILGKKEDDR